MSDLPDPWPTWVEGQLDAIRASNRLRHNRTFDARGPVGRLEGRVVTSYASNDYLGLSSHPIVRQAAAAKPPSSIETQFHRRLLAQEPGHIPREGSWRVK